MEITLIIVAGVVVTTLIAMVGDHLTRTKLARTSIDPQVVTDLTQKVAQLEIRLQEQDSKVQRLEADVSFTTKLLEKKS